MQRQVRQLIAAAALLAAGIAPARGDAPGSRVERPAYVVEVAGAGEVRPGVAAQFEVKLAARGGFHINAEYPSSFKVTAGSDAVRYPKPKVDRASGLAYDRCSGSDDSCAARAQIPFVVNRPGAHAVGGVLAFSVCDEEQCLIEKVPLSLAVVAR
jgi:hypothetical protein